MTLHTQAARRRGLGALAWVLALAAISCDPDQACDPGFYADHGGCYPLDAAAPSDDDDAGGGNGGGGNPNAKFGTPCSVQSDCGGVAPTCGAPQFPVCTAINCQAQPVNPCPATWTCLDVTAYTTDPSVTSVCVQL
jgi:hypothetical protein